MCRASPLPAQPFLCPLFTVRFPLEPLWAVGEPARWDGDASALPVLRLLLPMLQLGAGMWRQQMRRRRRRMKGTLWPWAGKWGQAA